MELRSTLLKGALSCALLLSLAGNSSAETTFKDGVIFCKVALTDMPKEEDAFLSVTLPATPGYSYTHDGAIYGATVWNLGTIACGGVYDSFYNGGPGYFRVQNSGNYPAYVYVSTGCESQISMGSKWFYAFEKFEDVFGGYICGISPVAGTQFLASSRGSYALAVSTDVTSIVPKWNMLSWCYGRLGDDDRFVDCSKATSFDGASRYYFNGTQFSIGSDPCAYLAYMPVGETQLFDLKFWAPYEKDYENCGFCVRVMASAFRLWDHVQ